MDSETNASLNSCAIGRRKQIGWRRRDEHGFRLSTEIACQLFPPAFFARDLAFLGSLLSPTSRLPGILLSPSLSCSAASTSRSSGGLFCLIMSLSGAELFRSAPLKNLTSFSINSMSCHGASGSTQHLEMKAATACAAQSAISNSNGAGRILFSNSEALPCFRFSFFSLRKNRRAR
jgi:hypothetical protein